LGTAIRIEQILVSLVKFGMGGTSERLQQQFTKHHDWFPQGDEVACGRSHSLGWDGANRNSGNPEKVYRALLERSVNEPFVVFDWRALDKGR
jgi:hypothetical protein